MHTFNQASSNYHAKGAMMLGASVLELGQGSDAVVFLHGLFATPEHWRPIMLELASQYRVLAPQLPVDPQPGRRRNGIHKIEELTEYIERLVGSLGLRQFVLCGNSLGGLVAIDYCVRNPGRAAGLVLAGSAGLYERGITNQARPRPTRSFVRATANDIIYDKSLITEQLVDEWYEAVRNRDYVRFLLRVSRATRDRNVEEELCLLKLPTLIVWGRNDEITPPDVAEEFQSRIEDARLEFIDHCGHSPNLERPKAFTRAIKGFLPRCFSQNPRLAEEVDTTVCGISC
jgi:pimeloyl-ACP methyl ester carboxylesterase